MGRIHGIIRVCGLVGWWNLLISCSLLVLIQGIGAQGTLKGTDKHVENAVNYPPTLAFDIVSIKESESSATHSTRLDDPDYEASFSAANITIRSLLTAAYGIDGHYISNLPEWDDLRYEVIAKSDISTTADLAKLHEPDVRLAKQHMLQLMLEERFHLKAHVELRPAPVYELRLTKKAPKLQQVTINAMSQSRAEECQGYEGHCGRQNCGPNGCELTAWSYSMIYLCKMIQGQLGSLVLDGTGLGGNYSFAMQYRGSTAKIAPDESSFPLVFEAVRTQLGMELVRADTSVRFLVIDSIEKPTPN